MRFAFVTYVPDFTVMENCVWTRITFDYTYMIIKKYFILI